MASARSRSRSPIVFTDLRTARSYLPQLARFEGAPGEALPIGLRVDVHITR